MIYLTCDIHHASLQTGNQKACDITELQVAQRFLKLLEEFDVKATFYISGKCFTEEWVDTRPLCEHELVDFGGHNYSCLEPELWHRLWNKLINSYNGPRWYQRWDVNKTRSVIQEKTGRDISLWRNHMYMHGPYTEEVLGEAGILICSDGVKADGNGLEPHPSGIFNFPINVMPDHEHLYHAERTVEWVKWWQDRYNWSDDFGPESYFIDQWTDIVLNQLESHRKEGIISHLIIHPITMYLCDEFQNLRRILSHIRQHDSGFVMDLLPASHKSRVISG